MNLADATAAGGAARPTGPPPSPRSTSSTATAPEGYRDAGAAARRGAEGGRRRPAGRAPRCGTRWRPTARPIRCCATWRACCGLSIRSTRRSRAAGGTAEGAGRARTMPWHALAEEQLALLDLRLGKTDAGEDDVASPGAGRDGAEWRARAGQRPAEPTGRVSRHDAETDGGGRSAAPGGFARAAGAGRLRAVGRLVRHHKTPLPGKREPVSR